MIFDRTGLVVFGAEGQLGMSLVHAAHRRGLPVAALTRGQADIADSESLRKACANLAPALVINAAAYTAVDGAETMPLAAYAVNERGAENAATVARDWGVPMIHVSTDYVFDGTRQTPYIETDAVNPLGVYGASKLAGERRVLRAHEGACVVRTSCVYGPSGTNFYRAILSGVESGRELEVVDDQTGCPTLAMDLAEALIKIAESLLERPSMPRDRVFHLAGREACSRYEWACGIAEEAVRYVGARASVTPIKTVSSPGQARRPSNSSLSTSLVRSTFGVEIMGWRDALPDLIHQYFTAARASQGALRRSYA